mmetsp:Transcript_48619/g.141682  ORF Transcript_48619/g.141682 Transcript_48619/m.141682 type:complete len:203 (-) Transcript_48619:522-1130(-)
MSKRRLLTMPSRWARMRSCVPDDVHPSLSRPATMRQRNGDDGGDSAADVAARSVRCWVAEERKFRQRAPPWPPSAGPGAQPPKPRMGATDGCRAPIHRCFRGHCAHSRRDERVESHMLEMPLSTKDSSAHRWSRKIWMKRPQRMAAPPPKTRQAHPRQHSSASRLARISRYAVAAVGPLSRPWSCRFAAAAAGTTRQTLQAA